MSKYNANVRTGNWYYDLILQEEKAKQYMRRSKNSELRVQKVRQVFLSLLKEVPLTFPIAGLSFGAVVQIVSPDMPTELRYKVKEKQGIALGADISYRDAGTRSELAHGDPVIGTSLMVPCARNVWRIVPEDESKQGKELRFGDAFHIQLHSSKTPLYVECVANSPTAQKGESGHVVPKLVAYTSTLTRFKVVHTDGGVRKDTEGTVVPAFERVCIMQAATTECLAVEPDIWFPTYLGMECEVSVHTFPDFKDKYKTDPKNFWSFILASG